MGSLWAPRPSSPSERQDLLFVFSILSSRSQSWRKQVFFQISPLVFGFPHCTVTSVDGLWIRYILITLTNWNRVMHFKVYIFKSRLWHIVLWGQPYALDHKFKYIFFVSHFKILQVSPDLDVIMFCQAKWAPQNWIHSLLRVQFTSWTPENNVKLCIWSFATTPVTLYLSTSRTACSDWSLTWKMAVGRVLMIPSCSLPPC